jgi:hypothetical protein
MTLQDWGAIGELLGAIAVVATLIYLAKQIGLHTRAMEESRKLALAQAYQVRSDALQDMLVRAADSEHIGPVIIKLTHNGYPEDLGAFDVLTDEERGRFRLWQIAQLTHWDNMYFQYQQGFLDREYYEDAFRERVRRLAPVWRALNVRSARRSFMEEIERLESSAARDARTP